MAAKYERMLKVLKERKLAEASGVILPSDAPAVAWYVYVLECADGSFYTGIAKDVHARLKQHNGGKGAAYTRSHGPVKLIYQETCADRSAALIREWEVKRLGRKGKEKLVAAARKPRRRKIKISTAG